MLWLFVQFSQHESLCHGLCQFWLVRFTFSEHFQTNLVQVFSCTQQQSCSQGHNCQGQELGLKGFSVDKYNTVAVLLFALSMTELNAKLLVSLRCRFIQFLSSTNGFNRASNYHFHHYADSDVCVLRLPMYSFLVYTHSCIFLLCLNHLKTKNHYQP